MIQAINPSDEAVEEGRAKLAAELRKMAMLAEGGRLPVFCAVYQVEKPGSDERSCGVMMNLLAHSSEMFTAIGQLTRLATMIQLGMPPADGETVQPGGVS